MHGSSRGGDVKNLVWEDKNIASLAKAKDADVYRYIAQNFDDSPDVFVGTGDLKGAKQVTKTNPFQSDYAWGRSELIEYKTDKGRRLQGALFYPAGYEPGKKYPISITLFTPAVMHSTTDQPGCRGRKTISGSNTMYPWLVKTLML